MGLILPNHNLPVTSGKWGSDMTKTITDHDNAINKLENDTNLNLTQLNGSVQLVSQQVRDVIGRYTTTRETVPNTTQTLGSGVFSTPSAGVAFSDSYGATSKTFTTGVDPRLVTAKVLTSATLGTQSEIWHQWYLDGVELTLNNYQSHPSLYLVPGVVVTTWTTGDWTWNDVTTNTFRQFLTIEASFLAWLTPGTHTIEVRYGADGFTGNSYSGIQISYLEIQVQGIVGPNYLNY